MLFDSKQLASYVWRRRCGSALAAPSLSSPIHLAAVSRVVLWIKTERVCILSQLHVVSECQSQCKFSHVEDLCITAVAPGIRFSGFETWLRYIAWPTTCEHIWACLLEKRWSARFGRLIYSTVLSRSWGLPAYTGIGIDQDSKVSSLARFACSGVSMVRWQRLVFGCNEDSLQGTQS